MRPHLFVLFGATGDLAAKKLFPALYRVSHGTEGTRVLGVGRSDWDDARLRDAAVGGLTGSGIEESDARAWADETLHFARVDAYDDLGPVFERAQEIETGAETDGNRAYYLALPPSAFPGTIAALGTHETEAGRAPDEEGQQSSGWTRLVIEKPFGSDLASAKSLNAIVHEHFREDQVYRIDHFLGKETVQNLLVFRFANALFESLWSRAHVERVEVIVTETNDASGRAGYFDGVGTMRDMIQNHLTQLFALTAMEPPARLDADGIRAEKVKVLRSTRTAAATEAVYGQYGEGDGNEAYADHEGVDADSTTETFAAVRLHVDNWRWQGVPFILRTGKRLKERLTEIVVTFRRPPVSLFQGTRDGCEPTPNVLRIRLQPDEGFRLSFDVKTPGSGFQTATENFDFRYEDTFGPLPDAYETLLRDVAAGDATLFVHAEEAEQAWRIYEPLLDADLEIHTYESGSWGPEAAESLGITLDPATTPTDC
ncbi:MAG: glucose-6-phosphate dehydrogenase [Bacteroidota bacterium]